MKVFGPLFVVAALACGPPDPAKIRLPAAAPPKPPATATRLGGAEWYVIDADVPFVVVASPAGLVATGTDEGPVKLKGQFAGGGGKVETRTYRGKQVTTVEPTGRGRVELIVIPVGFKSEAEITRVTLDVDGKAGPIDPPQPPADDAPIAGDGFKVLIVYDAAALNALTEGQQAAITGVPTRAYLTAKCAAGPDGATKEFRIWAADVDAANEAKTWQDALRRKRDALPWVVVSSRKPGERGTGFEGKLPDTLPEITTLLKKYGGE